jgi:hypothetical protein
MTAARPAKTMTMGEGGLALATLENFVEAAPQVGAKGRLFVRHA